MKLAELLECMHAWTYVGLLKMGLLCAVLMENEGHAEKRAIMRLRGPVLLHRGFLQAARGCLERMRAGDAVTRAAVLAKGLFFAAEGVWRPPVATEATAM